MSKSKAKAAQPELGEDKGVMPGPDECGVLGKEYLNRLDEEKSAKEKRVKAGDALAKKLRDGHRNTIRVDGVSIVLKHLDASDKLTVKHAKDK